MVIYGNGSTKASVYLGKKLLQGYLPFYVAGANREGRNLYPYTRLLPRQADNCDGVDEFEESREIFPSFLYWRYNHKGT